MRQIGRNDICWCGSQIKYKNCHMQFDERIKETVASAVADAAVKDGVARI